VAEAVWLKLIRELAGESPTIALLCKTAVARNVLQAAHGLSLPIETATIRRIDAARWFSAAVDACLFLVSLGTTNPRLRLPVYADLRQAEPDSLMGFANGLLVADCDAYARWAFADGVCPLTWRQGLKHDAAAVMELLRDSAVSAWRNRAGELVDVEEEFLYPLRKGRDLCETRPESPERAVLVTQDRLGADTRPLEHRAPRLWRYLKSHAAEFAKRKSSIYRGQPDFALFGIGPYCFAPFKVAISGLRKEPRFHALGPVRGRPVMLDDTCYFLPCTSAAEAAVLAALCNDPITLGFIRSAQFRDAKRPITKRLLKRIDFGAILARADWRELANRAQSVFGEEIDAPPIGPPSELIRRMQMEFTMPPFTP
jgi:hypothetical protein